MKGIDLYFICDTIISRNAIVLKGSPMISVLLASAISEDASLIYQDACERHVREVMKSKRFVNLAQKIKAEMPLIRDADIMRHLILAYSETIRTQ